MKRYESTQSTTVTRRDMLKLIGGVAGGAVMYQAMSSLGFAAESTYKGPMRLDGNPKGASVLILGAGVAGMAAAYEMRKAGYKVSVLEYREKAGGRCWTLRGGDRYKELGEAPAQECRFDKGMYINPGPWRIPYHHYGILDYCRLLGVQLEPFIQLNMNAYYHSTKAFGGKPQRIRHILADAQGHVAELLSKVTLQDKLDTPLTKEDREKLLAGLQYWGGLTKDYRYTKGVESSQRRGYDTEPGGGLMPLAAYSQPVGLQDLLNSDLWHFVSSFQGYEYQQTMFQPVGGMDMIAQAFARELDTVISYNTRVSKIAQNEKGVTVTAKDKNGKETLHNADWCICTIPLSILSQMDVQVSTKMLAAIDAVPYETGFKVGLQFARRFWEEDDRIFGGVSYTDLPLRNISYPMSNLNQGAKGVLLGCYTFGADSYKFSGMSPKERLERVLAFGAQIHPQYPKEFENGISVGWHRVPWSHGCHGQWTEESRKEHYNTLCDIDGRIVLAGEHTSYIAAWLEGGILSSQDAVERLHKRVLSK